MSQVAFAGINPTEMAIAKVWSWVLGTGWYGQVMGGTTKAVRCQVKRIVVGNTKDFQTGCCYVVRLKRWKLVLTQTGAGRISFDRNVGGRLCSPSLTPCNICVSRPVGSFVQPRKRVCHPYHCRSLIASQNGFVQVWRTLRGPHATFRWNYRVVIMHLLSSLLIQCHVAPIHRLAIPRLHCLIDTGVLSTFKPECVCIDKCIG